MSTIITLNEIKAILPKVDILEAMEEGFKAYSNGNTVVPPVGELIFDNPPGDVHIKYGYIKGDDYYVIKIASGFYENPKMGISSSQGMMLLFDQKTGQNVSVLLDEGYLTDIRTAAAGSLAAKYFAPQSVHAVGIIGTGVQAKLQLLQLQKNNPCTSVWLWGRNKRKAIKFREEVGDAFDIQIASSPTEVARNSNVIFTTTPSTSPLLYANDIKSGTLIVAVGSDTKDKQELDGNILEKADIIVSDSIPQSKSRGEIYQAVHANAISPDRIVELGHAIQHPDLQRTNEQQTIIVDLTGVAVQDIMITTAVYTEYQKTLNSSC